MSEITNWTYLSHTDAEKTVVETVHGTLLKAAHTALRLMDNDPLIALPSEQRRALLGKIEYDVGQSLRVGNLKWNAADEKSIPTEVKFALEFIEQSLNQSYATDIKDFNHRWSTLSSNPNPFAPVQFLRMVYSAQKAQALSVPAQKRMLLFVEKTLLEQLGFMFLELRTRFDELNISGTTVIPSNAPLVTAEDEALFNSLCDFLQSWEPSADILDAIGAPNRTLTPAEILTVVSNLQKLVPKMLEEALGYPDGRLAQNIKDSMLQHAEDVLGLPKENLAISDDDQAAVNLVDDVFAHNLYERKIHHASRTILAQILFPSVKASILNRRWFAQEEHPAREFIASVSDAVAPSDGVLHNDLVEQAAQSVHQLVNGFNEDVSIFGVLTQEMQEYAEEKKERDWEQLVVSREKIRGELRKMWSRVNAPQPVIDFALELGGEHLATLEAKHERFTPKWEAALITLNQLFNTKSMLSNKVKIDGLLRDGLMDMLVSCGWTGVRAHNRLAEQEDVIHAYYVLGQRDFPTVTSFPLPPRPIHRRKEKDATLVAQPSVPAQNDLSSTASVDDKIQYLQINDSVQWINTQNERLTLRLSYISPLSMKHLFVNESGARVLVGNPKELKKMVDDGRLFL